MHTIPTSQMHLMRRHILMLHLYSILQPLSSYNYKWFLLGFHKGNTPLHLYK